MSAALDALLDEIGAARIAAGAAARLGISHDEAEVCWTAIVSEARMALDWLEAEQAPLTGRVLEIGAGSGLLASVLRARGVDVVAIEPVGEGFAFTDAVQAELASILGMRAVAPLRAPAEALNPDPHGRFDLIFSINVLEHMRPLHPNLDGMARVLAPGGVMIHTCPNYTFPYEPHYRMPLLPGAPALTPYLGKPRLRHEPLWRSLNFITAGDVKRFAGRHGLSAKLAAGKLAEAIERTQSDLAFASRHRGAPAVAIAMVRKLGLTPLLRRLPAEWVTPMTVRISGV